MRESHQKGRVCESRQEGRVRESCQECRVCPGKVRMLLSLLLFWKSARLHQKFLAVKLCVEDIRAFRGRYIIIIYCGNIAHLLINVKITSASEHRDWYNVLCLMYIV